MGIGKALVASIDVYRSEVKNFTGPFSTGTPNVFLESGSLNTLLISEIRAALADPANSESLTALLAIDNAPELLGNSDGDPAIELAFLISNGLAGAIPLAP